MRSSRTIGLVGCLMLLLPGLAGCSDDSTNVDEGSETTTPGGAESNDGSTSTTETASGSTAVTWELPRTTQYGNLLITAKSAERRAWKDKDATEDDDEDVDWAIVGLTLENLANDVDWSFPYGIFHLELADGTDVAGEGSSESSVEVQKGSDRAGEVAFALDAGADLKGAKLSVYESDRHPATIPLDGKYTFKEAKPVPVTITPTSLSSGGTIKCYLGGMGYATKWEISDLEAFAVRDQPLSPAEAPGGAGDFTSGPGRGSHTRASEDSVLVVIRAKVTVAEAGGATGCSPSIAITADGLTVEKANWNLSRKGDNITVSDGTQLVQWTFDVPVDTADLTAVWANPEGQSLQIDPSFLRQFTDE